MGFLHHYEESSIINVPNTQVFAFIDDHSRFSSHMNKSSWMMGGGKMETRLDKGKGQKIGSHISMGGKVFGINLFLDEVVTEYLPPRRKTWKTVGSPKLIVIGSYQMGVELTPKSGKTKLKVFIDYDLPSGASRILGQLFGKMYAKWCVRQMLAGVVELGR